ncbi:MAG: hypothetical protein ABSC20_06310 [Candidatus Bathyarchaeia archaeon]|jgi:hypothetical protein
MVDEQKQNQGDNAAHNKSGLKGYMDANIALIGDKETLKSSVNDVDVRELSNDPANPDVYTVESEGKIAPQLKAGNSDSIKFSEMSRFCKEHEVISSSVVTGQKSSGLPKSVGKEDIRDGHRGA